MESDFIKDINNVLISEVVSQENGHTSEVHKIAKNCLKALMNFNSKEKKAQMEHKDTLTDGEYKQMLLKEASMSMIAHLLLDNRQKMVIKKIFKIMDESGDGQLNGHELKKCFQEIFKDAPDRDEQGNLLGGVWSDKDLN